MKSYAKYLLTHHTWLMWLSEYPQMKVSLMCRVSSCQTRAPPALYVMRAGSHLLVLRCGTARLVSHSLMVENAAPAWWFDIFLIPKRLTLPLWDILKPNMRLSIWKGKFTIFFKCSLWWGVCYFCNRRDGCSWEWDFSTNCIPELFEQTSPVNSCPAVPPVYWPGSLLCPKQNPVTWQRNPL